MAARAFSFIPDFAILQGMVLTRLKTRILENPLVYRLVQAPIAEQKLRPLYTHNDMTAPGRVLDLGCGPGTNTHHFKEAEYLGIDINEDYITQARRRHGREFIAADITKYEVEADSRFDFILLNSFLHHIGDKDTDRILAHVNTLLSPTGHVHLIDLVLPEHPCLAKMLARLDRGDHPRRVEHWRKICQQHFTPEVFEVNTIRLLGLPGWHLIYCKGKPG